MSRAPSPTSLAAKLLTLAPGETLIFYDRRTKGTATNMERQAHNLFAKNTTLRERAFTTRRLIVVHPETATADHVLAITRI